MLTHEQLDLIWNIEIACLRCIRASEYFKVVSKAKRNVWIYTQNFYGGICVIHWCQVFGNYNEPTHYSKLFTDALDIKNSLCKKIGITSDQYDIFWEGAKNARDKFLVHNEYSSDDRPVFPDTDIMKVMCLEMRNKLKHFIISVPSNDAEYIKYHDYFANHENDELIYEIEKELKVLKKAIKIQI